MYRSQIKNTLRSLWGSERFSGVGTWWEVALSSREWLQGGGGRNYNNVLWSSFHATHVVEKQVRGKLSRVKSREGSIDAEIPTDLLPVVCLFCISIHTVVRAYRNTDHLTGFLCEIGVNCG